MEELVKKDILNIIEKTLEAIKEGNLGNLEKLSNHTIHNASIFQDEHSISIAVIIWSISKILNRIGSDNILVNLLDEALRELRDGDIGSYSDTIRTLTQHLHSLDKKANLYLQEVLKRAQIKKGSKLYDHGISLGRASELLGISQWELMSYVGKTNLSDEDSKGVSIKKRLDFSRRLFSL